MTRILKIPANTQGYLTAVRDEVGDRFHVTNFEFNYINQPSVTPWDLPDQVIEMLGSCIGDGYDTVDAPCEESFIYFDPDKYDGTCEFFFEVVGWCYNNDDDYNPNGPLPVKLVDSDGVVYATIQMDDNSDDVWNESKYWYDYYWYTSAAFTPPTEPKFLAVQLCGTGSWYEDGMELQAARVRIRQTGATKTRTMIPMVHGWGEGFDDPQPSLWVYNSADFEGTKTIWLEANLWAWPGHTLYLYNVTDSVVVAGSYLDSGAGGVQRVQIPTENLISGKTYRVDSADVQPIMAWLVFEVEECTKLATWYRIGMQSSDSYWDGGRDYREEWTGVDYLADIHCRNYFRKAASITAAYFECTGEVGPAGGGYGVAPRLASGTHDWYGSTLSSCALTFSGGKAYQRSGDILGSLVDGGKYGAWSGGVIPTPTNYAYVLPCGSFIVVTAEAP